MPFTLDQLDFLNVRLQVPVPPPFLDNKRKEHAYNQRLPGFTARSAQISQRGDVDVVTSLLDKARQAATAKKFADALSGLDALEAALANPDPWEEADAKAKAALNQLSRSPGVTKDAVDNLTTAYNTAVADRQNGKPKESIAALTKLEKDVQAAIAEGAKALKSAKVQKEQDLDQVDRVKFAENAEAQGTLETLVAKDTIGKALGGQAVDMSAIETILKDHNKEVPAEKRAFGDFEDIDDVLRRVKDPEERRKTLQPIGNAMAAAIERQHKLRAELAKLKLTNPGRDETKPRTKKEQAEYEAAVQAHHAASGMLMRMTDHLPESWLASWTPNFKDRIANLCKSDTQRKLDLAAELQVVKTPNPDQAKDQQAYKEYIEPGTMGSMERSDFYFDAYVEAPKPDKARAIAESQTRLLAQARKIRDLGGSIRDCEAVFAHIPRQWWPAEFLEEMQAWRKTERALQRERVAEAFKKAPPKLETAKEVYEWVKDLLFQAGDVESDVAGLGAKVEMVTDAVDDPNPPPTLLNNALTDQGPAKKLDDTNWAEDSNVAQQLSNWMGCIKSNYETIEKIVKVIKSGDIKKNLAELKEGDAQAWADFSEEFLKAGSGVLNAITAVSKLKGVADPMSDWATRVLPGMSIACCSIDLFSAIKKLTEHSVIKAKTSKLSEHGAIFLAEGKHEDAGAFLSAMENEMGARKRQIGKDSVEVTTTSLELVGSIGEASGIGAVPGMAIKITGKTISYGSKVIFTGIEWGIAKQARGLIKEAQAGNPVARVQLFENSALYSKMYIALLVQDGDVLAKKFIIDRGIEEDDLSGPMGLKILREAMLESADQKDETEFSAAEELVGGLAKVPKVIKEKSAAIAKAYRNRGEKDAGGYKEDQALPAPLLSGAAWETAKAAAIKNHMFNEPTGIGDGLTAVEKAKQKAEKLEKSAGKPDKVKEAYLEYYDALGSVHSLAFSYSPCILSSGEDGPSGFHKPMTTYLNGLCRLLEKEMEAVDKDKLQLTAGRASLALPAVELKSATWGKVMAAAKEAHLPEKDCGVKAALVALEKLEKDPKLKGAKVQEKRKALLDAVKCCNDLLTGLKNYWVECGDCQPMRDYISQLITQTVTKGKDFNQQVHESPAAKAFTWANQNFASKDWKAMWKDACEKGVVTQADGDGGIGDALAEWEKANAAYDKQVSTPSKPMELVKKRRAVKLALSKVLQATVTLLSTSNVHKFVQEYAGKLKDGVSPKMTALKDAQKAIALTMPAVDFTAETWDKAFGEAMKKGIVAKDKSVEELSKALKTANKEEKVFRDILAFNKEKRVAATKVNVALAAVQQHLGIVRGMFEDAHANLDTYMEGLAGELNTKLNNADLEKAMDGSAATITPALGAFAWENKKWQEEKKKLVAGGVVEDKTTGFGKLLDSSGEAFDKWDKAKTTNKKGQPDPKLEKAKAALAVKARESTVKVRAAARAFKAATKNADFQRFCEEYVTEANRRIALLM